MFAFGKSDDDDDDEEEMESLLPASTFQPASQTPQLLINHMKLMMDLYPAKYGYLRCLDSVKSDQDRFIAKYAEMLFENCESSNRRKEIIESGGIRLSVWKAIMEKIAPSLSHVYHLHLQFTAECFTFSGPNPILVDPCTDIHILFANNRLRRVDLRCRRNS